QSYDWRLLECELSRAERPFAARALHQPIEFIERRGGMRMESLLQDLRFGARMLLKQPGFTLIAVITLALGIGATTAIYTVVNAVLLHPFAYPHSEQLMFLSQKYKGDAADREFAVSYPNFQDWQKQQQVFSHLAAMRGTTLTLTGVSVPEQVHGAYLSPDAFPMLGFAPLRGRVFTAADNHPIATRTAVISYAFWQAHFAGAEDIVGKTLLLDQQTYTVLGVMPPPFKIWGAQIWLPIGLFANEEALQTRRALLGIYGVARLKPNVSLAQARAEMDLISERLAAQYPATNKDTAIKIVPFIENAIENIRPSLLLLLGAVGFVLLIACANVANLLFTQAAAREKEIALRSALGASRARLILQLLIETVPLTLLGGLLGWLLASWGLQAMLALLPAEVIFAESNVQMDGRVLWFALGLLTLTTLCCGLLPAWRFSRTDVSESLKDGARTTTGGLHNRRLRDALVVTEVALSVILLIGAGLLARSFQQMRQVELGFDREHLLSLDLSLPEKKYADAPRTITFYRTLVERLAALPGVTHAGLMIGAPFSRRSLSLPLVRDGEVLKDMQEAMQKPPVFYVPLEGASLAALGLPLHAGRLLNERDVAGAPPVAVVSQALADKYFAGQNPLGQRILLGFPENINKPGMLPKGFDKFDWMTIVGVVGDTRPVSLIETEVALTAYVPFAQAPPAPVVLNTGTLLLRTSGAPSALTHAARQQVLALDPDQPVAKLATMDALITDSMKPQRFNTLLMGIFAALALMLAAVGLYGVLAYTVVQRTHEIGIRLALGAPARAIIKLVLGQGMRLTLYGIALGLAGAFGLTRLLEHLLFGVSKTDPLTFVGIALLLLVVAALACWIPARRATKVDPMIALRSE
ncbi:MAG: ABC transporter permease, partial [Blastocatellia bacterium]